MTPPRIVKARRLRLALELAGAVSILLVFAIATGAL